MARWGHNHCTHDAVTAGKKEAAGAKEMADYVKLKLQEEKNNC